MGSIKKNLAKRYLSDRSIFNNRMVVELVEKLHIHYRNLRLSLSIDDWTEFCQAMVDSYNRWIKLDKPEPNKDKHIELSRRKVATDVYNDEIQINLNHNLYNKNKDKIFAEGAGFSDSLYCHIKIRDLRIECSLEEFKLLADAFKEAKEVLDVIEK